MKQYLPQTWRVLRELADADETFRRDFEISFLPARDPVRRFRYCNELWEMNPQWGDSARNAAREIISLVARHAASSSYRPNWPDSPDRQKKLLSLIADATGGEAPTIENIRKKLKFGKVGQSPFCLPRKSEKAET
jgi:hypothetical protein